MVAFSWGITPWFAYILMRESGRTRAQAWRMFALTLVWAAISWALIKADLGLEESMIFQLRPLIMLSLSIGMVFVLEWFRGNLPAIFAQPAGWGDLAVAVAALAVLILYRGKPIPKPAVYGVAILGFADFASVFFFGFLSSATPVQLLSFDFPNRVIEYPTGPIPLFLVPFAVVFHILSIAEANRVGRERKRRMVSNGS
jgi:hypothetical protein